MELDNEIFLTVRDLGLAAALVSAGFNVGSLIKDQEERTNFTFSRSFEIECAISSYWNGSLTVQARNYSDNIKMLKSRIYAEK